MYVIFIFVSLVICEYYNLFYNGNFNDHKQSIFYIIFTIIEKKNMFLDTVEGSNPVVPYHIGTHSRWGSSNHYLT